MQSPVFSRFFNHISRFLPLFGYTQMALSHYWGFNCWNVCFGVNYPPISRKISILFFIIFSIISQDCRFQRAFQDLPLFLSKKYQSPAFYDLGLGTYAIIIYLKLKDQFSNLFTPKWVRFPKFNLFIIT